MNIYYGKVNFLKETKRALRESSHEPKDIQWIGSKDCSFAISWEEFVKLADFEYNPSSEAQIIPEDLVIVGKEWWLERDEYDGVEWWEYKVQPQIRYDHKPIRNLMKSGVFYTTVADVNEGEE